MIRAQLPQLTKIAGIPERYPGLTFLLLIFLTVVGVVFAARLPVGAPVVALPAAIAVRAELPGIDGRTLEALVTQPLKSALSNLADVQALEGRTRAGRVEILLRFESAARRDDALQAARQRVAAAIPRLPSGMDPPVVESRDEQKPAVAVFAITADVLTGEVVRWVERVLATPIRELPEVAGVTVEGAAEPEVVVRPDMRRLAALGLSFDDLIQALRRTAEAPRRKRSPRGVVTPGTADAIAARAVSLPNGEPIALGEVANVTTVLKEPTDPPRLGGAPVLRVQVFAQTERNAGYVADRATAHLAWLRANDLIPADVSVHTISDQATSSRQLLKQLARRGGLFLAFALLITGIALGIRRAGLLTSALVVWLPVSGAALWLAGVGLNAMTVAGLVLATVLFAFVVLLPWLSRMAIALIVVAIVLWLVSSMAGAYAGLLASFAIGVLLAIVVAWLLTPWSRARRLATPLLARLLPSDHRALWRVFSVPLLLGGIALIAAIAVHALLSARATETSGVLTLRLQNDKAADLSLFATQEAAELRRIEGAEILSLSVEPVDVWRIELDAARLSDFAIALPEIGRALSIAQDGLVVGRTMHGDTTFPLRVQLPSTAAGDQFERLLLRGEQKGGASVYLRDVGLMLRERQPREIIELDGEPAAEVRIRWTTREARDALQRAHRKLSLTKGLTVTLHLQTESKPLAP